MTLSGNRLIAPLLSRLQGKLGKRFTRFIGVAIASLAATEIMLTICDAVFHMTSTPAALLAWFAGAVVSYILSRWAWERKGRPDVLRETIPFWVISAMVIVVLTLANKFGYHSASWMHLHGAKHVLWVDFVWLCANFVTFVLRFVIFHYVLFAENSPLSAARAAATPEVAAPDLPNGIPPQPKGEAPRGARQSASQADLPGWRGGNPRQPGKANDDGARGTRYGSRRA